MGLKVALGEIVPCAEAGGLLERKNLKGKGGRQSFPTKASQEKQEKDHPTYRRSSMYQVHWHRETNDVPFFFFYFQFRGPCLWSVSFTPWKTNVRGKCPKERIDWTGQLSPNQVRILNILCCPQSHKGSQGPWRGWYFIILQHVTECETRHDMK